MSHQHGPNCNHGPTTGPTGQKTIQINDANKAPNPFKEIANYLKSEKSGIKPRQGVFNGKRFDYFKGKKAIEVVMTESYAKATKTEKTLSRDEAFELMNNMGKFGFILRVDKGNSIGGKGSPRVLQPNLQQEFKEDGYYMWIWEGSRFKVYLGAVALVAIVLAGVLFPLWPNFLRLGVWYLSIGVLCLIGAFFGIALIRLVLYVITYPILPRGFWLFPNLFEDCGVIESFIPLYGFDPVKDPKKSKSKKQVTDSKPTTATTIESEGLKTE